MRIYRQPEIYSELFKKFAKLEEKEKKPVLTSDANIHFYIILCNIL